MKTQAFLLAVTLMLGSRALADISPDWQVIPCCASDVAVGVDGTVWITGHAVGGNGDVFRWNGSTWVKQEGVRGSAIAVDSQGLPWIVNYGGDIFRPLGGTWVKVPGLANDIAIGADGSIWITGYNFNFDGFQNGDIFRWNGSTWVKEEGVKAVKISVAPNGDPTVVNTDGDIFRRANGAWIKQTGQAGDVGIGADGSIWITGTRPDGLNHDIFRWNGSAWEKALDMEGTRLAVAPNGEPWVVQRDGDLFLGRLNTGGPNPPIIDGSDITVGLTGVNVKVASTTGATYHLDAKSSLSAPAWQSVDDKAGTGAEIILHDGRELGPMAIYRVRITEP